MPQCADGVDARQCPTCGTGQLSLKLGKFGAFIGCSNYPECRFTAYHKPLAEPCPSCGRPYLLEKESKKRSTLAPVESMTFEVIKPKRKERDF